MLTLTTITTRDRRGGVRPGAGRKPNGLRRPGPLPCAACGQLYAAASKRVDGWVPAKCPACLAVASAPASPVADAPDPVALATDLLRRLAEEPHIPAAYRAAARRHLRRLGA